MTLFLTLLVFLGLLTYFMLKRRVAQITQTPLWVFWLILMAPAFTWMVWLLINGEDKPLPLALLVFPFLLCPLLCRWLIELGRPKEKEKPKITEAETTQASEGEEDLVKTNPLRPITVNEEKSLRDCFTWDIYFLQHLNYHPQAIFCLGKLRANPDMAYQTIQENVRKVFGDRFLVFFQEDMQNQPFFALVPNPWQQSKAPAETEPITRPFLALGLLIVALLTTAWGAVQAQSTGIIAQSNSSASLDILYYCLSLIAILGFHEFSHYFVAVCYKVRTTLPYFIPFPFFPGTLGAYIQMRSPIPHRKALFDIAIAGPLGGFVVTVIVLLWGLSLSDVVLLTDKSGILSFQSVDPRFSFLFAIFGKIMLGSALASDKAIALHPLAVAGYLGLLITALNLMPVGQLDGGHIVQAMFGQRTGIIVGQLARLVILIMAFIHSEFLFFAIFLLLMPASDRPALNNVTELDNKRDFLGLLSLTLLIAILLPVPGMVTQWWNF